MITNVCIFLSRLDFAIVAFYGPEEKLGLENGFPRSWAGLMGLD
jgi:hypothetical protein